MSYLAYKVPIPGEWKLHLIFFVTQLELVAARNLDLFSKLYLSCLFSIFMKDNIDILKLFELKSFLIKKWWKKTRAIQWNIWFIRKDTDLNVIDDITSRIQMMTLALLVILKLAFWPNKTILLIFGSAFSHLEPNMLLANIFI